MDHLPQTLLRLGMWLFTTQRPRAPCAHPPDFLRVPLLLLGVAVRTGRPGLHGLEQERSALAAYESPQGSA